MTTEIWKENFPESRIFKTYKRWITKNDDKVSNICFWNKKVWWIEEDKLFPSWHYKNPWHINCRCIIEYKSSTFKPELTRKEKWDIVLRLALDMFKDKWKHFSDNWVKDYSWNILWLSNEFNPAFYTKVNMVLLEFAKETQNGESNIKMNLDFTEYSHNKPQTYDKNWNQVWWEVIIDWTAVYLADIWNLLFWYSWRNANIPYNTLELAANSATWLKVLLIWWIVEDNEKDDRVFYKLWYELADKYKPSDLIIEVLKEYLLRWTYEANKIRRSK